VPQLDNIEEITKKNEEGEEVKEWVTIKNPQFKHLNICMNLIDDDVKEDLQAVLERTTDDFGVTISSNKLTEEVIEEIHQKIRDLHKGNVEILTKQAEEAGEDASTIVEDPHIHLKRLAV
jgi:RNA-binding protein YhbY